MAVLTIERYAVRPEALAAVERAMHELATRVRQELPDTAWTSFRDAADPTQLVAMVRADDTAAADQYRNAPCTLAFRATLAPLLTAPLEVAAYELVTSSDLGRRPPAGDRRRRPPRSRGR